MSKETVELVEDKETKEVENEVIYEGYSIGELIGKDAVTKIKNSL